MIDAPAEADNLYLPDRIKPLLTLTPRSAAPMQPANATRGQISYGEQATGLPS
jgi:hypothetical protein